ncbi:MAG: hypothetical protein QOE40_131 [Actinomycetota bacterium]|nr:hypothetical protein [Actinomycetota bacterium]
MTASPVPPRTPAVLLEAALRADPARALLTYYDDATAERTELSVMTFANWVAKTANLCRDELGLDVGATVAIDLPLHWQAAVWWQACWAGGLVPSAPTVPTPVRAGAAAAATTARAYDVAVVAVGADHPAPLADAVVGLGLGPMGLPVPGRPTPPEVTLDYDREVHGHGDRFTPPRLEPGSPAVTLGAQTLTAAELGDAVAEAVARWGLTPADRVLTTMPFGPLPSLLGGLLGPLASGAGAVLCANLDRIDAAALARRVDQEAVTRVTPGARFSGSQVRPLD